MFCQKRFFLCVLLFFKSMKTRYRFLMLGILFTQDFNVEDLLCGALSGSKSSLVFSNYLFGLGLSLFEMNFSMALFGFQLPREASSGG